jgi:SAM-dependent methyltransferase
MSDREREPGSLDPEQVRRDTIAYYDRRPVLGDSWDNEPAGTFHDPAPERAALEAALRNVVEGRRALELGCGTGEGTRVAAPVATSILAIDSGETCIRLARQRSQSRHVEFQVGDAFELDHLPNDFSAGFACGLFHLLPEAAYDSFLRAFHARLVSGSPVFLCASRARTLRAKKRQFRVERSPDQFCVRTLTDGSKYDIINNEFDEPKLRSIFEHRTEKLSVTVGDASWWVTYTVP